ncbi:hypothetical protein MTsPCn3_25650 [Erythrobacter sp. MTPC3]
MATSPEGKTSQDKIAKSIFYDLNSIFPEANSVGRPNTAGTGNLIDRWRNDLPVAEKIALIKKSLGLVLVAATVFFAIGFVEIGLSNSAKIAIAGLPGSFHEGDPPGPLFLFGSIGQQNGDIASCGLAIRIDIFA